MSKAKKTVGTSNMVRLEKVLSAKTDNQKEYIRNIINNEITLCYGPAGTGKTFIAAGMACQSLEKDLIDSIILTRPMVQCGKGLGFLPGDLNEKFLPYLIPLLDQVNYFLGASQVKTLLFHGKIKIIPLELARGMNFDNTFVILDEAQNADKEQLKMFLTRLGKDSRMVINGDVRQNDIKGSDFYDTVEKLRDLEGVGISTLDLSDMQRNPLLVSILKRLDD